MMKFINSFLLWKMVSTFEDSYKHINGKILEVEKGKTGKLKILDIGCSDLVNTKKYLKNVKNYQLYAFDHFDFIDDRSVEYKKIDLEDEFFPYKENFFDIIIAGQVIEHILNKDHLLKESYRVLKQGGLFICATENIASFDNIISLLFGQEPISQHTGSKYNTQSFLSPHFMKKVDSDFGNKYFHKNVCSYFGLKRLMKINGFEKAKIYSLGNINRLFEKLFPIYNRILISYSNK